MYSPAAAAIPNHPDWAVRLSAPVATGSLPFGLFVMLALAVAVLLGLVVWMAKQILRPGRAARDRPVSGCTTCTSWPGSTRSGTC